MHTPRRHRVARNEAKFRQLAAALAGPTSEDALKEMERRAQARVRMYMPDAPFAPWKLEVEPSWRRTPAVEEGIDWDGMSLAERRDRES